MGFCRTIVYMTEVLYSTFKDRSYIALKVVALSQLTTFSAIQQKKLLRMQIKLFSS